MAFHNSKGHLPCSFGASAARGLHSACEVGPGEVLYLPTEWYHATCNLDDFCVNALSANNAGHGSVEGNMGAPRTLVVLNYNDQHFDHCLPLRG